MGTGTTVEIKQIKLGPTVDEKEYDLKRMRRANNRHEKKKK